MSVAARLPKLAGRRPVSWLSATENILSGGPRGLLPATTGGGSVPTSAQWARSMWVRLENCESAGTVPTSVGCSRRSSTDSWFQMPTVPNRVSRLLPP